MRELSRHRGRQKLPRPSLTARSTKSGVIDDQTGKSLHEEVSLLRVAR